MVGLLELLLVEEEFWPACKVELLEVTPAGENLKREGLILVVPELLVHFLL